MKSFLFGCALVPVFLAPAALAAGSGQTSWPQWRGPLGTGVSPTADPPLTWSETDHVKWKTKIPGAGTATPIVWGDRVFILTAIPTGKKPATKSPQAPSPPPPPTSPGGAGANAPAGPPGGPGRPGGPGGPPGGRPPRPQAPDEVFQFAVLCLDRGTGKILWQKIAREEAPHEGHHETHGFASASPVTDGELLFAYFGSRGLHCYDFEGNAKWTKDFGRMQTKNGFGEGASPALYGDTVIVVWDHEGDDFIIALDKRTGKELWRTPRDEGTGWATPLVVENGAQRQVVVNATGKVRSYDLATGKELWSCAGQTVNAIPTPVASDGTVYVTSGFRGTALYAFGLGQTGDLEGTAGVRWTYKKNTPYVPSPLLADNLLYFVANNDAKLTCLDAKTGQPHFEAERIEGLFSVYASPVAAKDRLYLLGREGTCVVLKKGEKPEVLATNKIQDKTDATLALAGRELFLRGHEALYCISE